NTQHGRSRQRRQRRHPDRRTAACTSVTRSARASASLFELCCSVGVTSMDVRALGRPAKVWRTSRRDVRVSMQKTKNSEHIGFIEAATRARCANLRQSPEASATTNGGWRVPGVVREASYDYAGRTAIHPSNSRRGRPCLVTANTRCTTMHAACDDAGSSIRNQYNTSRRRCERWDVRRIKEVRSLPTILSSFFPFELNSSEGTGCPAFCTTAVLFVTHVLTNHIHHALLNRFLCPCRRCDRGTGFGTAHQPLVPRSR
ncbi:uncharacterized protein C8Q71DRAFT_888885, partial [Rhodofomes roseus]